MTNTDNSCFLDSLEEHPCKRHKKAPRYFDCEECREVYLKATERDLIQDGDAYRFFPESLEKTLERSRVFNLLIHSGEKGSVLDWTIEKLRSVGREPTQEQRDDLAAEYLFRLLDSRLRYHVQFALDPRIHRPSIRDEILKDLCRTVRDELKQNLYFSLFRKELEVWTTRTKRGSATIIDAPMGLGKTAAIILGLIDNKDISAVIFFPTIDLIEWFLFQLKNQVALNVKKYSADQIAALMEDYLEKGEYDGDSFPIEFLKDEVFYLEGANAEECPHFRLIVKRYSKNILQKWKICNRCDQKDSCRFLRQIDDAKKARIIVTTHKQYDRFYGNRSLRKWNKNGGRIERDFFIIDENFLISNCFEPQVFDYNDFADFIGEINKFLDDNDRPKEIMDKLYALLGRVATVKKTSVIPPLDANFSFAPETKKKWNDFYADELFYQTEISNYLDFLEEAIRIGCVVQRYNKGFIEETDEESDKKVFKVFLPNPKKYHLKGLPSHILFDGTPLDHKFLELKLISDDIENIRIKVPPLGYVRVCQDASSDLPRRRISYDKERVKEYVERVFEKYGKEHKYFVLCTKKAEELYLKEFLAEKEKEFGVEVILRHYGATRGINDAKNCTVGLMLGSYLVSDALDLAYALPLIQDKLTSWKPITSEDNFWRWIGNRSQREYTDPIVKDISHWIRTTEQKQGMARTRHINHGVDFYAISKDCVKQYEPDAKDAGSDMTIHLSPVKSKPSKSPYLNDVERIVPEFIDKGEKFKRIQVFYRLREERPKVNRRDTINKLADMVVEKYGWDRRGYTYYPPSEK